jgi:hypothetical protein
MIFENLPTFSMKTISSFLAKPTKSILETKISIETQLKIEWTRIFVSEFQKNLLLLLFVEIIKAPIFSAPDVSRI